MADEVAQETMTRAYERWSRVAKHPNPVAWVLDVAWKVSMELARRRDRRPRRLLRASMVAPPDESCLSRPLLVAALRRLTERQRLVFLARYLFAHDVAGTADLLGMTPQQVKDASREARARLHVVLEAHEEDLLG